MHNFVLWAPEGLGWLNDPKGAGLRKFLGLLIEGLVLGFVTGLCLAGLVALAYRLSAHASGAIFTSYFLVVGGFLGCVGVGVSPYN
jgi:hypothetical protein